MKRYILTFTVLLASIALMQAQDVLRPSGKRSVRTVEVPRYEKLLLDDSSIKIVLVDGTNNKITVDADDAMHPIIKTQVKDGVLRVFLDDGRAVSMIETGGIKVKIPMRNVEEVATKGFITLSSEGVLRLDNCKLLLDNTSSTNLDLDGEDLTLKYTVAKGKVNVRCHRLTLEMTIARDFQISGRTDELTLKTGSDLKAYDLRVEKATLDASGIGKIYLNVEDEIKGKVSGIMEVHLRGEATNLLQTDGSKAVVIREK
ncbi:Putative auto-transporter adhesin, head GIN domain [Capnocytophaga haemolytica]|jgi:hypothetical protein|uniref:Protein of uncharacterized function (DUF2807) n=1 Tax=Capnocytophaga haemolytica TaxID=45243 RepID=A0AAX2H0X7_9FLAO|nr:DUF2807 domain-containing protein [Capnocytophaga haemolytica]AMD84632.1 hypothetical protein AXF12_03295 [Capnocytophaga haemolytica]SFO22121.1 Putative auto-transporter adhesin, head GIN domain [Capnocytophaga haemolytica]SNV08812.1 Protein of uncharacterised function (DUF2807) [Capnocytophaga haemolytica]